MADLLTPGEVAAQLGVQDRTVRRMAAAYEAVFEDLPRLRPDDDRSPRLWPVDAARRVQVAHMALKTGKVASLEQALVVVRDGGDLPVKAEPLTGQGPDTLPAGMLADLLTEFRAIVRAETADLVREVQALRSELAAIKTLPAPAEAGVGKRARRSSPGPSRGSEGLEGVTVTLLRVATATLPSGLKNILRWPPSRYIDLEAVLQSTQAVRLDRSSGKPVWRRDDGKHMRRDTVVRLLNAGVLTSME